MEAVPDYTRGIAKITTWAEAELSAEQLQEAKAEVERIIRQIKANQKP